MENQILDLFKSIIDQDRCQIVICNLDHEIVYMNPQAVKDYAKRGGAALIGKNLLNCHNPQSQKKIKEVIEWFQESEDHNLVHTYYSESHHWDVYMAALRADGKLIGYYEKHEVREKDTMKFYDLW